MPRGRGRRLNSNRLLERRVTVFLRRGRWRANCTAAGYRPEPGFYGNLPDSQQSNRTDSASVPDTGNIQVMFGHGRSETYIDITTKGKSKNPSCSE